MIQQKLFPGTITKYKGRLLLSVVACLVAFLALTFPYEKPLDESQPGYITSIWPAPNDEVWGSWYALSLKTALPGAFPGRVGITIEIRPGKGITPFELVAKDKHATNLPLEKRVNLSLNDGLIDAGNPIVCLNDLTAILEPNNKSDYGSGLAGRYIFCWPVSLPPGKHIAKLSVSTRAGEVLEYEWTFIIK